VVVAEFGVDLGGGDGDVAQELLDDPDVRPVGQHVAGAGMSQDMGADHGSEADPLGAVLDDGPGPLAAEASAPGVDEDGLGVGAPAPLVGGQEGPTVG
jgi:hypothetical protein